MNIKDKIFHHLYINDYFKAEELSYVLLEGVTLKQTRYLAR